ncbi:sigma-70 family RNA polymerase sigma factor [Paenibacillus urinalis]|uniref:Sigma-70 family RNA polymerase sigma factor n=1 Tax=Paenibacillus urinalis TaxID=521520 RepID=A0AAX3N4Z0_9BACL|nr:sigma-70 family RNA polymerase sigma factor [Paenibacillus urinalis]WDH84770.1 sigma-70 family RNA polymerase sigma factor [Paenibacillus urinalis]
MDLHELAAKSRDGDEEAFIERLHVDKHRMYSIAYSYMRNEADALDAVQETVSRVWAKRKTLRQPEYFTTWVIRILIRVCMDERKKRKRELPSGTEEMDISTKVAVAGDPAQKIDMENLVTALPPKYRMVIVLKYYRDLTITEIAELLDRPDGTIRTWLNKALKMMRVETQDKEEIDHALHNRRVGTSRIKG